MKIQKTMLNLTNDKNTCLDCPAAILAGNIDFRSCSQSLEKRIQIEEGEEIVIMCKRRPELGYFEPNITFDQCPEWKLSNNGYILNNISEIIGAMKKYEYRSKFI